MTDNPALLALLITVAGTGMVLLGYAIGRARLDRALRREHYRTWREAEQAWRGRLAQIEADSRPAAPPPPVAAAIRRCLAEPSAPRSGRSARFLRNL